MASNTHHSTVHALDTAQNTVLQSGGRHKMVTAHRHKMHLRKQHCTGDLTKAAPENHDACKPCTCTTHLYRAIRMR